MRELIKVPLRSDSIACNGVIQKDRTMTPLMLTRWPLYQLTDLKLTPNRTMIGRFFHTSDVIINTCINTSISELCISKNQINSLSLVWDRPSQPLASIIEPAIYDHPHWGLTVYKYQQYPSCIK